MKENKTFQAGEAAAATESCATPLTCRIPVVDDDIGILQSSGEVPIHFRHCAELSGTLNNSLRANDGACGQIELLSTGQTPAIGQRFAAVKIPIPSSEPPEPG